MVHCGKSVGQNIVDVAELVAYCMHEKDVFVHEESRGYALRFRRNSGWFFLRTLSGENTFELLFKSAIPVWSGVFDGISRAELRNKLISSYISGFQHEGETYMWKSSEEGDFMSMCHCKPDMPVTVINIADAIATRLQMEEVWLKQAVDSGYDVLFETNSSWFKIEHFVVEKNKTLSFQLELIKGGMVSWRGTYNSTTLEKFDKEFSEKVTGGFLIDGGRYYWESTTCPRHPISLDDDFKLPESCPYQEGATNELRDVRVVALKYDGKVIAYRFKTNIGFFDMSKSVAASFGLGEYKTEKFITLKSVGGMLMSDSEIKKRKCVPDVSEDADTCKRLIDALFDS